jgi:transposase-like protein
MSTAKQRDPGKEQFWRRLLAQWRDSGLSVRAFCRQHRLTEPNFYAWRRILDQRDAHGPRFVPVRVVPEPQPPAGNDSAPTAQAALELLLGPTRRLRIAPGFDAPTLRRLLALLEEKAT